MAKLKVQKIPARTLETVRAIVDDGVFESAPGAIACAVDVLARVLAELGKTPADRAGTEYLRADDLLVRLREVWDSPDQHMARELADARREAAGWKELLDRMEGIAREFRGIAREAVK